MTPFLLHRPGALAIAALSLLYASTVAQAQGDDDVTRSSIGEVVWEKNISVDSSEVTVAYGMKFLSDGGLLFNGGPEMLGQGPGYLMKVDASGERQWVRSYSHKDSLIYMFTAIERAPDTLQFIGFRATAILFPLLYPYSLTTDQRGNFISARQGASPLVNGGNVLIPSGTSGYVESGTEWAGTQESRGAVFLRKVTFGGEVVWEKSYGRGIDKYVLPIKILATADGGFALLVGQTDTTQIVSRAGIIRTDADGKVIWRKRYDTSVGFPEAIVETADGGFTFAGRISDWSIPQMKTTVVHVDAQGEVS